MVEGDKPVRLVVLLPVTLAASMVKNADAARKLGYTVLEEEVPEHNNAVLPPRR